VDLFETAIERAKHVRGFMVGFSISREAREEIARAKRHRNLQIEFIPASELLAKAPTDRIVRELEEQQLSFDQILAPVRAPRQRPAAKVLVASELEGQNESAVARRSAG
jgi:hypothetical protein